MKRNALRELEKWKAPRKKAMPRNRCWGFVRVRVHRTLLAACLGLALCVCHAAAPNPAFGMLPAIVVPPFEYGLATPYSYAEDLGVGFDRSMMFIWTLVQPDPTVAQYQWLFDQHLADTPQGMGLLANISLGNPDQDPRYTDYAVSATSFLPKNETAYRAFVKAVVERYDGDGTNDMPGLSVPIKYWQVDNEPPHGLTGYAAFLKMTYQAVKEADPGAKVLIGGVGGMPPLNTYLQNFDAQFAPILDDLAAMGEGPYFDVFDFHWYGDATDDYLGLKPVFEHIRAAVESRGLAPAQGYWITEMGTYSGDPKPLPFLGNVDYPLQTERQQAVDLVRRNVYSLGQGVRKVFMAYGIPEGFKLDEGYFDFTGLVYDGRYANDEGKGVKKLSYYAYKKMAEKLSPLDASGAAAEHDADGLHVVRLARDGRRLWVAWNDGVATNVVLNLSPGATGVVVTASVPTASAGKLVADYATAFAVESLAATGTSPPQATVALGDDTPLYVEERIADLPPRLLGIALRDGKVEVLYTGNEVGCVEPYVMMRATNLLSGGWCPVDAAVPRPASPTITNAWAQPQPDADAAFYQLRTE